MRRPLLTALLCLAPLGASAYDRFDEDFSSDATSRTPYRAAYLLAGASEAVYDSGDMLRRRIRNLGLEFVDFKVRRGKSSQAVIARSDGYLVVAVRGTMGPVDALQDARITRTRKWSSKDLAVHDGFADQAGSLYPWVLRQVNANRGNRKVVLTGHSQGGAVALLLAYRLQQDAGVRVDQVMVFAAPHAGGKPWASAYNALLASRTSRWINQHDPVPHLPQGKNWRPVGQRHVIRLEGKNNKAKRTLCETKCKTKTKKKKRRDCKTRCKDRWRDIRESPKVHFFAGSTPDKDMSALGDHKMPTYLRRIWDGMPDAKHGRMPTPQVVDPNR